jgi:prepilin-type N-terminal cleavage/methylation domain-containing protein
MTRASSPKGFSLIELLIVVVVIGIMAAIAMQSLTVAVEDTRRLETERKLERLADAIVGDPEKMQDGVRSDFGYVGDVGVFPSNLAALYTSPGYATWRGPYLQIEHTADTVSFRFDAWGQAVTYSGGITVTSSGHGTPITKKLCDSATDYLQNLVVGAIRDKNDSTPGLINKDSVRIIVEIPSGPGGVVSRIYNPEASGAFSCDSVPAGRRFFRFVYSPANDTVRRYYTVLPRHQGNPQLTVKFAGAYFSGGGSGCTGTSTVTLRPNGVGAITNIPNQTGCAANWQCVGEITADDATSAVSRNSNNWATDVYALSDPPTSSCTIVSVTVYCRAMRDLTQGDIEPTIYVGGTEFNGASTALTNSWSNYSHGWTTNPATGSPWSWADITGLQAGARIRGQNVNFSARLTQVWVVVTY